MSRTRKDRPYWVRVNDPNSSRRASHGHMITCHEKIGEEPVYRSVPSKDGWHWREEVSYNRPLFRRWTEPVPCTLDVPERRSSNSWRMAPRRLGEERNEYLRNDKHCNYWLNYDGDYVSGKSWKHLTNSAVRGKVKEQLNAAVKSYGSYWEDGDWDEVDVFVDSKHAGNGWYDW